MTAMVAGEALLIMWITFTVLGTAALVAVLVWAVRSRQFADQDRKRHLPLWSGIPADDEPDDGAAEKTRQKEQKAKT